MSQKESNFRPLTSKEYPTAEEVVLVNSGQESRLVNFAKSGWFRWGTPVGVLFGAVFGPQLIDEAEKTAPAPVVRPIDRLLGDNEVRADHGPVHGPNYVPREDPPVVPPIGPNPVSPLPNLPNPTDIPHIPITPTPTPFFPTPSPTPRPPEATPSPSPTPAETLVQLEAKTRIDANGNRQFDGEDLGISRTVLAWRDVNRNGEFDQGEPFQIAQTDGFGVRVFNFKGVGFGPGDQLCAQDHEVSPTSKLVTLIRKGCDTVNGARLAVVRLLFGNVESPPPSATPIPTPRTPEPTATPVPTPRLETPPPTPIPTKPPVIIVTPRPEKTPPPPVIIKTPPPEVKRTPPPEVVIVTTPPPAVEEAEVVCPDGKALPPEFQNKVIGPDAKKIADRLAELKCKLIKHAEDSTKEHEGILTRIGEIKTAIGDLVVKIVEPFIRQHGEDTEKIKGAVGLGPGEVPIDQQIGVKPGGKSIAERVDDLGHDIWDRIDTGASVVAGAGALAILGAGLVARRRLRRRFQGIDQSFTQVGGRFDQLSTDVQGVQGRVDQLSTDVRERADRLEQMVQGLQPPAGEPGAGAGTKGGLQEETAGVSKLSDEDIATFAEIFSTIKPLIDELRQMNDQQLEQVAQKMPLELFGKARDLLDKTGRLPAGLKDMELQPVPALTVPILKLLMSFYDDLSDEEKARIDQLVSERGSQQ